MPDASPPQGPPPQDPGLRFAGLAAAAMLLQVGLGAGLRAFMAGIAVPIGHFAHTRHAHSHLGYYGVLVPLLWWTWARAGQAVPGPRATAVYAIATFAATWGFAREGYGPLSISASTVVLAFWLHGAWSSWRALLAPRSWWGAAGPSIVGAAVAIPAVALTLPTDPALAQELVQGFLTLLLFGAFTPAALALAGALPPRPLPWTLGTFGVALAMGPWPAWPARLLAVALVLQLAVAAWPLAPAERRMPWLVVSLAVGLVAGGAVPETWAFSIAGLHFAILGPVLLELGRPLLPPLGRLGRRAYLLLVAALTVPVLAPQVLPAGTAPRIAALAGALMAAWWLLAVLRGGLRAADEG